ncbi:MAG: LysR family transcriptional regulator [Methylococcaceae bacterium]
MRKSITKTAEFLNLGQPAVSGQIKLLHDYVGEPLYQRKSHQLELIPTGEGLLECANRVDKSYKQTLEYEHC